MTRKLFTILAAVALLVGLGISAKADDIEDPIYNITVGSGTLLASGNFATVQLTLGYGTGYDGSACTLSAPCIKVVVTALGEYEFTAGGHDYVFGFNQVGPNDLTVRSLPSGFSVDGNNKNLDSFGYFEWVIKKDGGSSTSFSFVVSRDGGFSSTSQLYALSTDGSSSKGYGDFAVYLKDDHCIPTEGWARDNPNPVPEPGTLMLFGTGLLSMAGFIRRKLSA